MSHSENKVFYAMPKGWCYHTKRSCPMLAYGQFRLHGYREITLEEAERRGLHPCRCVYDENYGGSDK